MNLITINRKVFHNYLTIRSLQFLFLNGTEATRYKAQVRPDIKNCLIKNST